MSAIVIIFNRMLAVREKCIQWKIIFSFNVKCSNLSLSSHYHDLYIFNDEHSAFQIWYSYIIYHTIYMYHTAE